MAKIVFKVIIIIVLACAISFVYGKFNSKFCVPNEFYIPYMRLYAEEVGGELIYEIREGFRYIYNLNNIFMCIHGPTFIYLGEGEIEGKRQFQDPRFRVFIHECYYINTLHGAFRQSPNPLHPLTGSTSTEAKKGMSSCDHLSLTDQIGFGSVPNIPDLHQKIWGILLLGKFDNYEAGKLTVFYAPQYEITTEFTYATDFKDAPPMTNKRFGISMVTIGNVSGCITVLGKTFTIVTKPNKVSQMCFRIQKNEEIDKTFTKLPINAVIDMKVLNGYSTSFEPPIITDPEAASVISPCAPSPYPVILLDDCMDLPTIEDECEQVAIDSEFSCKMLRIIVGSEVPEIPEPVKWHQDVVYLLAHIFYKSCPLIPLDFISATTSIIDYYISVTADDSTNSTAPSKPREFWDFVLNALSTCAKNVAPMDFVGVHPFMSVTQFKADLRFKNRTGLGVNTEDVKLHYYMEVADHEFTFNHMIDMMWIMFATVLGICPSYYDTEIGSISSRLYTMFSEDILIPMKHYWVNPTHNPTFEILMGRYLNHETHLRALSCLEASYIQSSTTAYRFQRPLTVPISACETAGNGFV